MHWLGRALRLTAAIIATGCNPSADISAPEPSVEVVQDIGPEGLQMGTLLTSFPTAQASIAHLATYCLEATGGDATLSVERKIVPQITISDAMAQPGRYLYIPGGRSTDGHLYDTQCSHYFAEDGAEPSQLTQQLAGTFGRDPLPAYAAASEISTLVSDPASQLEISGTFLFDGVERPTRLLFVGGRLTAARISFGSFSETEFQQLITALDERYALIDPSEAEFRDYDALHRSCVGFATEDRSVALSVARTQQARINNWVGELWVTYALPDAPRRLVSSECFPAASLPHSEGGL